MHDPSRHPPVSVLENYFRHGIQGVLTVDGNPTARVVIEPAYRTVAIRFPAEGDSPDVVAFENIAFETITDDGVVWHQMMVLLDDNLDEVWAVLCTIVDRVQLGHQTFAAAVAESLESMSDILALRRGLTREKQAGLLGELLTLLALAEDVGPAMAAAGWRGPDSEEHDFGLAEDDVEVKTTRSERRAHWISSATQLMPTGDRALHLLSIQITLAAAGHGWSLPTLIDMTRTSLGDSATRLDARLVELGYYSRDADLYRARWTLRSTPEFFAVDSSFPALTRPDIDAIVPASERLTDVRYRIDLTGLEPRPELFSFDFLIPASVT